MVETVEVRLRHDQRVFSAKSGDVLGRSSEADLQVDGDVVSRRHAQLHRGPSGWFLTDLESANGLHGPDGLKRQRIELGGGTTRFSLGPPEAGCELEIIIPEQLAQVVTRRCLLYTSPSPRDATLSRMPSSA